MTPQQIIDMAEEAGLVDMDFDLSHWQAHEFINFAKLVAKAKAEEIATELLKGPVNDTAASIAIWIRDQA